MKDAEDISGYRSQIPAVAMRMATCCRWCEVSCSDKESNLMSGLHASSTWAAGMAALQLLLRLTDGM